MSSKPVIRALSEREWAFVSHVSGVDAEMHGAPEPHVRLRWRCRGEDGEPSAFVQALSIGYAHALALALRETLELAGHWDETAAPTTLPRA